MAIPRMIFANPAGEILDHPDLAMCGMDGVSPRPVREEELIPLPEGSDVFTLPARTPLGLDEDTGEVVAFDTHDGYAPLGVGAFMAPAHTQSLRPAYATHEGAPVLPTYAYTSMGYRDGQFWVAGLRVDPDPRQDPWRFDRAEIALEVERFLKISPDNQVMGQIQRCALEYGCRAAQNFFLSRWEAPLPVSVACNAQCIGCISLQPDGEFQAAHDRLSTAPSPEDVAQVALDHIGRVEEAVVSFGQGCEGEPLLLTDVLVDATRIIRAATGEGTVNLNTNGSLPDSVSQLLGVGLDAIRVSLNSPRPDLYRAYYQPRGYDVDAPVESLRRVHSAGGFTAINLFVFPGVTDTDEELTAIEALIEDTGLEMIQLRNLNIDPEVYQRSIPRGTIRQGMGIARFMGELQGRFPRLRFGYFNPPKERYRAWRSGGGGGDEAR